jgi:hypothetical protein
MERGLFSFPGGEMGMLEEAGAERLVSNDGAVQQFLCSFDFRGFCGVGSMD